MFLSHQEEPSHRNMIIDLCRLGISAAIITTTLRYHTRLERGSQREAQRHADASILLLSETALSARFGSDNHHRVSPSTRSMIMAVALWQRRDPVTDGCGSRQFAVQIEDRTRTEQRPQKLPPANPALPSVQAEEVRASVDKNSQMGFHTRNPYVWQRTSQFKASITEAVSIV